MAQEFMNKISLLGKNEQIKECFYFVNKKIHAHLFLHTEEYQNLKGNKQFIVTNFDQSEEIMNLDSFFDYMISDHIMIGEHISMISLKEICTRRYPIPAEWLVELGEKFPEVLVEFQRFGDCSGLVHAVIQNNKLILLRTLDLEAGYRDHYRHHHPLLTHFIPSLIGEISLGK